MYKTINSRFHKLFQGPQKKKIFYGGAGSGKSVAIAQHFCQGLCSGDGYRRLVLRKYFPSMKVSTLIVLKSILDSWGIEYTHHKTDNYLKVGKNYLFTLGLEDSERIKGGEFKEVWMEEATEFSEEDYKQLVIRLARDKYSEDVTIYLSFNPIDQNHWCVRLAEHAKQHPEEFLLHHSTYKDNLKNLSKTFVSELENLMTVDENFYRIYTLGEPGILKNRIYDHFSIEDSTQWDWEKLHNNSIHCYGLDFGFNHPMALCEVWFYENELYVKELFYKTGQTTEDLVLWMFENGVSQTDYIFADSAEPDRIEMLNTSRFAKTVKSDTGEEVSQYIPRYNVYQAKKDVRAGIIFIKGKKVHLCSQSINAIKEYQNYKYKETADGFPIEEPVKMYDDFLDSFRYAAYSMNLNLGFTPPESLARGSSYASLITNSRYKKPFSGMNLDIVKDPLK
jgi:phage terminase large subunit